MVAIIEFMFRDGQITKYINTDDLFNDIKEKMHNETDPVKKAEIAQKIIDLKKGV